MAINEYLTLSIPDVISLYETDERARNKIEQLFVIKQLNEIHFSDMSAATFYAMIVSSLVRKKPSEVLKLYNQCNYKHASKYFNDVQVLMKYINTLGTDTVGNFTDYESMLDSFVSIVEGINQYGGKQATVSSYIVKNIDPVWNKPIKMSLRVNYQVDLSDDSYEEDEGDLTVEYKKFRIYFELTSDLIVILHVATRLNLIPYGHTVEEYKIRRLRRNVVKRMNELGLYPEYEDQKVYV